MNEPETMTPVPPETPPPRRRYRAFKIAAIVAAVCIVAMACLAFWAGSSSCENLVRKRVIASLETSTGGRVEIASFQWQPFHLQARAEGVVIHGREAAGEAPYARVELINVQISILGFLSPHILLRGLDVKRPQLHFIIYPDGSTNQPQPRRPPKPGKPALATFFNLKAGRVSVEQGVILFEDRAAKFDFKQRLEPFSLAARDISLTLAYVPRQAAYPESYHIETGARDFVLTRGAAVHPIESPVEGRLQARLDLTRNAVYLRSLSITAHERGVPDRTLVVAGVLKDFTRPRWQLKSQGQLDMRLLEPITGYPNAPEGIARLDLTAQGHDGEFGIDGTVHVDGGAYVANGVNARGVRLDARVHADPEQLAISSIIARLRQGGELRGQVLLSHWLPPIPGTAVMQASEPSVETSRRSRRPVRSQAAPAKPSRKALARSVEGRVTAQLDGVSIDTVLDIVGRQPFRRLGLDGRLFGPATATWTNGDVGTLAVSARLTVQPSGQTAPAQASSASGSPAIREIPVTGIIDATYTQRNGAVDLRSLDLALPASHIIARGHLGAYPVTSTSSISINFQSRDLTEFDGILRDLGLKRNGRAGTAALPISLGGEAGFDGTWTGSLVDPHIAGSLHASNLTADVPGQTAAGKSRLIRWDSLQASGSYSAARIAIEKAHLSHGAATITLDGTLTAAASSAAATGMLSTAARRTRGKETPSFNSNSLLQGHLVAGNVDVADLLPFLNSDFPIAGQLSAELDASGPLHTIRATGWAELHNGSVAGEPVTRIRAQGSIAGRVLHIDSLTAASDAGSASASGDYDLDSRRFHVQARAAGVDLTRIQRLRRAGLNATGTLDFTLTGSGLIDDPQLQGRGSLTGLTLNGEKLGAVEVAAHTLNHSLLYDVTTHLASAQFSAHGQTALSGDFATQARLDFTRFDIGAVLHMIHVPGLTGESSLAGTITVSGPLAHPRQLVGDASLQNMAVTIVGVHLRSDGPVHATLANERISLDPIHITGEETDLHVRGNLAFNDGRPLDLAASGTINLKLIETLDSDVTASGTTTFQVEARGTLQHPDLRGRIEFQDASLALEDLPNSLSHLKGTLVFNQNRLEVRSLTATSGGGQLSVGGYLSYQRGIFADLSLTGKGIRIRYPQGISSLADAKLELQGPQSNLHLSGNVLITRFTVSPDLDIAALAAQATRVQPVVSPDAPSNHISLDVHIQSSPQLNFQNAYAKLAGDVDLRLRGTVATPSLLGRVSIIEGSALIAGTRYDLQRGDISFTNPVRIQPSIDLNATAHVDDYDITLGLHGTIDKPTVTYRSDPPLAEADVVALLALGRTQSGQRIYTQQQEAEGANPTTDALLGGALNATVSSRVQRLFGAGSVKVDPSYLGALGNSTTRITVEEQLGRSVTLTYATNVNTTAQQLLQAEIAINRHVSLLVTRDESGVFSMVVKATRRYR
ncbi:MAG TPA: translocation/assembly module TamB domain-containing protein [Terracidiphilus sp.]|nr:translocation/assembly module TamB domain-containing protein [Terracidiphilus sp.]